MQAPDIAVRALSGNGNVRILTCVSTQLTNELQHRHDTWPVASAALGRTTSIAAMMGLLLKGQERLTIQIKGDGPLGTILVDADSSGHVRGYVDNPHVHLPSNSQGKLDVGTGVGAGLLHVMRDMGLKDVYRGSAELQSGEIADDFTYYFAVSEQTPSAVGAGVLVDTDNHVIVSGGFIAQLMPGHTDEDITALEKHVAEIRSVTDFLQDGSSAEDLLKVIAPDAHILERQPISFQCTCSRDRIAASLKSLGEAEIRSLIEERGEAEAVCHFCNEKYVFTKEELTQLLL